MKSVFVIPTYNEKDNLPKIFEALKALNIDGLHLLIVDDNSPDGTGQIADQLVSENPDRVQVLHREGKQGLGTAYIQGFQLALAGGADAVGQMDADFSHPPEKVREFINSLDKADIVVGSRYIPGGSLDENWPVWRKWLSKFGNFYAGSILRMPFKDITGGFRLWRREALEKMPLDSIRSNGYVFQVEMAYVAYKLGLSFYEVPFYFADRKWGDSKMSFRIQVEAALRVWKLLWMYRNLK